MKYIYYFLLIFSLHIANAQESECEVEYYQSELMSYMHQSGKKLAKALVAENPEYQEAILENEEYWFEDMYELGSHEDTSHYLVKFNFSYDYNIKDPNSFEPTDFISLATYNPNDSEFPVRKPVHLMIHNGEKIMNADGEVCKFQIKLVVHDEDINHQDAYKHYDNLELRFFHENNTFVEEEPITENIILTLSDRLDRDIPVVQIPYKHVQKNTSLSSVVLKDTLNEEYCPNYNDGRPCLMTHFDAQTYCGTKYENTIPEIKDLARAFHPAGINRTEKEKFAVYKSEDEIDFYYKERKYTPSQEHQEYLNENPGDLFKKVWAINPVPQAVASRYVFNLETGAIEQSNEGNRLPVICIEKQETLINGKPRY